MIDPIVSYYLELTKPREEDEGDLAALSPFAGLVEPGKRPAPPRPTKGLNVRQLSPFAGLVSREQAAPPSPEQATNLIVNARGSVADIARQRLAALGVNPDEPIDASANREKALSPWERALLSVTTPPPEATRTERQPPKPPPSATSLPRRADPNAVRVAREEMERGGLPLEQSAGYMPGVSEFLFKNINPALDYYDDDQTKNVLKDTWSNLTDSRHRKLNETQRGREHLAELEDAWRMYLGMSQKKNSFGISDYVPSKSVGETPYYYKLNDPMSVFMRDVATSNEGLDSNERLKRVVEMVRANGGSMPAFDETELGWALKNHTLGTGQDEKGPYLSYYDKWDLAPHMNGKTWNVSGSVGQPFEIYDRVYFDPSTYETIPPWPPRPEVEPLWESGYFGRDQYPQAAEEWASDVKGYEAGVAADVKERQEMEAIAKNGLPLSQIEGDPEVIIDLLRKHNLLDKYAEQYKKKSGKTFSAYGGEGN